jgi:hypothetical protein
LALAAAPAGAADGAESQRKTAIHEAIRTIRSVPEGGSRYQYVMTGAVRLGLFWISRDDVGLGTIRTGRNAAGHEFIHLVIGSDPDKAPMGINRWGLATEVLDATSAESVFFGLMKPSNNASPAAARRDAAQAGGERWFQVLIGRNRSGSAVSVGKLIALSHEFTVKEAPAVQEAALSHLEGEADPRVADGGPCGRCPGFLFSVRELIGEAITGRPAPARRCYRYNGRVLTATLLRSEPVGERKIVLRRRDGSSRTRVYRGLRRAQFEVLDRRTGERSAFELLVGASGALAGVPLQIEYHPNWWLKLTLTLAPESPEWERAAAADGRQ